MKYKFQVVYSLLFKLFSLIISFYSVRVQLELLGNYNYSKWVVLFNIINWVLIIDFGVGNSIRNKITYAYHKRKYNVVSALIGRAYILSGCIALTFFTVLLLLLQFKLIELDRSELILLSFFILTFCLLPINQICHSFNNSQVVISIQLLISFLSVSVLIYIKTYFGTISMNSMSYIYGGCTFFSYFFITTFYLVKKENVKIILDLKMKRVFSLLRPGIQFFVLQIYSLIIFATDRVILGEIGSSHDVLYYDVISRYFNIYIVFAIIMSTPLWALVRKVSLSGEPKTLSKFINKVYLTQLIGLFILIAMSILAPFVFQLWLGGNIGIQGISYLHISYIAMVSWCYSLYSSFANISNGLRIFKPQLVIGLICCILKIPLCVAMSLLLKDPFLGVTSSTIICLIPFPLFFLVTIKKALSIESIRNYHHLQ